MAKELGRVQRDPLFLALTRPAMIFGVPYTYAMFNMMIWALVFVNTKDFGLLIPGAVIVHLIGYYVSAYEPRFMDIIGIWARTVPTCINRFYHGNTCSYDLY
jgi:type IV secretion system protein VirB3